MTTARETMNRSMSEADLLVRVCDELRLAGWRYVHFNRSDLAQMRGHPGLPDLIAVRKDRLLFVELKAEKGRIRPGQDLWLTDLQTVAYHHSGSPETWIVKPSSLDTFLAFLR